MNLKKVLIIDDDIDLAEAMATGFDKMKYEVVVVGDPQRAQSLLEFERFDIVITDFDMPKITGAGIAAKVGMSEHPAPVILITGKNIPDSISSMGEVVEVLEKPFDNEKLVNTVEKWLNLTSP